MEIDRGIDLLLQVLIECGKYLIIAGLGIFRHIPLQRHWLKIRPPCVSSAKTGVRQPVSIAPASTKETTPVFLPILIPPSAFCLTFDVQTSDIPCDEIPGRLPSGLFARHFGCF